MFLRAPVRDARDVLRALQHRLVQQPRHRAERVVRRDRKIVYHTIESDVHAVDQPPAERARGLDATWL